MSTAAYIKKIRVSDDDGVSYEELTATTGSLDFGTNVLNDTEMATNVGFNSKCYGLHDWSISADNIAVIGDAALAIIRNGLLNRTVVKAQYLPDGTVPNGFEGNIVVENFNQSGGVDDLETITMTLQGNGALAAAT